MEKRSGWWAPLACVTLMLGLAGCYGDDPLGLVEDDVVVPVPGAALASLECRVDLGGASIGCAVPEPGAPQGLSAAVVNLGGQGSYLLLESFDVGYDESSKVFSAMVTVRNLLNQPLGTADGVTPDTAGIRVYFVEEPTNGVTVLDPSGVGSFTASNQAYHQYDQVLVPGRRSTAQSWRWSVPDDVTEFTFRVALAAEVPGTTYDASGRPLALDPQTITVGGYHSCGLTLAGAAYCWGSNEFGQLGNGDTLRAVGPVAVQGSHTFTEITAGLKHTCALTMDGEAYCWGLSSDGQVGNGDFGMSDPDDTLSFTHRTTPVLVSGGHRYRAISSGGLNTCAITEAGLAYCWGRGREGQLGDGRSGIDSTDPTRYVFAVTPNQVNGAGYVAISVGSVHICALDELGGTWCWGSNEWGQLGNGEGGPESLSDVPALVNAPVQFTSISAGLTHTCALTRDGEAYCWGETSAGRLGNGEGAGIAQFRTSPQPVSGGLAFASISAGAIHSCGLTREGEAYCWGRNQDGQLATSAPADSAVTPVPAVVDPGVGPFAAIGAWGDNEGGHTCALTIAGSIYCWGNNAEGQIGAPMGAGRNEVPVQIGILQLFAFERHALRQSWVRS